MSNRKPMGLNSFSFSSFYETSERARGGDENTGEGDTRVSNKVGHERRGGSWLRRNTRDGL